MTEKSLKVEVRNIHFELMAYTRSLELCSRMNYETENLDFIDLIPENSVLYDLGACEGRFSVYAAKKNIHVIAFEPDEYNFKVFQQNIHLNNLQNQIKAYKLGVGNLNSAAIMKIGQPWSGGHQKVVQFEDYKRNDLNFDFKQEATIEIIRLDDFIEKNNLPIPDYLKIDIDGSEFPFMEGAQKTIHNPHLKSIIFELFINDPKFNDIINYLTEAGFKEKSRHQVPNEPSLFNFIFVR